MRAKWNGMEDCTFWFFSTKIGKYTYMTIYVAGRGGLMSGRTRSFLI